MASCVSPLSLNVPELGWIAVPCGECNYCLGARRDDWSFRLRQELKCSVRGDFITLTYAPESLPTVLESTGEYFANGTLVRKHVQLFVKRLRKRCSAERLRYYLVGEYGTDDDRPHYHILLFGMLPEKLRQVELAWTFGHVHYGELNDASIHYTTKYVINRHGDFGGREPPFCFMSRRPGIGERYVETHGSWHRDGLYPFAWVNGVVQRLPRYYSDKIFNEGEKMAIAHVRLHEREKLEPQSLEEIKYEAVQHIWNHELVFKRLNEKNKL